MAQKYWTNLGLRIKKYAQDEGATMPVIAELLGVNRRTMNRWFTGERRPNNEQLRAVQELLSIEQDDADALLHLSEEPYIFRKSRNASQRKKRKMSSPSVGLVPDLTDLINEAMRERHCNMMQLAETLHIPRGTLQSWTQGVVPRQNSPYWDILRDFFPHAFESAPVQEVVDGLAEQDTTLHPEELVGPIPPDNTMSLQEMPADEPLIPTITRAGEQPDTQFSFTIGLRGTGTPEGCAESVRNFLAYLTAQPNNTAPTPIAPIETHNIVVEEDAAPSPTEETETCDPVPPQTEPCPVAELRTTDPVAYLAVLLQDALPLARDLGDDDSPEGIENRKRLRELAGAGVVYEFGNILYDKLPGERARDAAKRQSLHEYEGDGE